jgi:hypothetical protein
MEEEDVWMSHHSITHHREILSSPKAEQVLGATRNNNRPVPPFVESDLDFLVRGLEIRRPASTRRPPMTHISPLGIRPNDILKANELKTAREAPFHLPTLLVLFATLLAQHW